MPSSRPSPRASGGTSVNTRRTPRSGASTNADTSKPSLSARSGATSNGTTGTSRQSKSGATTNGTTTPKESTSAKSGRTTNGSTSPATGSAGSTRLSSLLRRRLESAGSTESERPETEEPPQPAAQPAPQPPEPKPEEPSRVKRPAYEPGLTSLMSEVSGRLKRRLKRDRDLDDAEDDGTSVGKTSQTGSATTGLSSRIRRRLKSSATSKTSKTSTSEGQTEGETETDTEDESEGETETDTDEEGSDKSKSSTVDKSHCKICGTKVVPGKFKSCVYDHVICFECFGFGDSDAEEGQALSSNTCIACQKKLLDPEKNIDGYPPRFLKFYLLRKLLEQDPGLCDVATSHKKGKIQAVFFCIDCDVHACKDCLLDHLDGGEKSSHNLLNLQVANYKCEKLFCFSCHVNEAVAYCPEQNCDQPLCANCVRDKHKFHSAFNLTQSQRNMLMYINKQRVVIREYRQSVDIELQRRKELREAKTQELEELVLAIKEAAELHRKMIDEDEKKLLDVVQKHTDDIFSVYKTLDEAVNRKDIILKYFENIHEKIREKKMDEERRIDAFSFCRENDNLLKTHKELHQRTNLKFEAELATMKFTKREDIEKFRLQGNNILGSLNVKERKVDPDRLQMSNYTLSIDVRGRHDRCAPELGQILYLEGTNKIAVVDDANCRVKIISKYDGVLYSKDPDVRIDYVDNGKIIGVGDRVLLTYNKRDQLLLVCNASQDKMYVFGLDGKKVWHYSMPPGAGHALCLHHADGAVYVGRSHISMDKSGGILEIHMMLQKGRYQLLRQQDRYYLDHRPKWVTTTPSGYTIIYDGSTLVYLSKSLNYIRTEDRRHKEWHGLDASDIFMTETGHMVVVDHMNLYADNAITVLNEDGYVVGFPLASSGEEGDEISGPLLITGDNGEHFYVVDQQKDRIKVLHNS